MWSQLPKQTQDKISEEERQAVFHAFWGSGSLAKQRDYLCNVANKIQKKSTTVKSYSRRRPSYEFRLKFQDKCFKVCKTMLLDISDSVVLQH